MSILPNSLRSLMLTSLMCFAAPIVGIGLVLASLWAFSYIPGLDAIAESAATTLVQFLATFGSGSPREGLFVIGTTCSFVGFLFDTYRQFA